MNVTMRFGGLLANERYQLRRARRGVYGRHRPERGRQDDPVQRPLRALCRRPRARRVRRPAHHRLAAAHRSPRAVSCAPIQLVQLFKDLTVLRTSKVGLHCVTRGGIADSRSLPPALGTPSRSPHRPRGARAPRLRRPGARPTCVADKLPYGRQRLLEVARALAARTQAAAAGRARRRPQHAGDRGARRRDPARQCSPASPCC